CAGVGQNGLQEKSAYPLQVPSSSQALKLLICLKKMSFGTGLRVGTNIRANMQTRKVVCTTTTGARTACRPKPGLVARAWYKDCKLPLGKTTVRQPAIGSATSCTLVWRAH